MAEKVYEKVIANEYLNVQKKIKGSSPLETRIKAKAQEAKWARLERLHKELDLTGSLKELAGYKTRQAGNALDACNNILKTNLCAAAKLDWASFYDDRLLPPFVFKEYPPRYEQVAKDMGLPRKSFLSELLFPFLKKKRLALEKAARESFEKQMRDYNARKESAQAGYLEQRAAFLEEQSEFNRSVDHLQLDVEKGDPAAVASFVCIALAGLELPDAIDVDFDAVYYRPDKLVLVCATLPDPLAMPRVVRYEYHEEENGISPVEMDRNKFDDFYESAVLQIVLSAVHRIFSTIPARQIHTVWLNGLAGDGKTCILTCKASREQFNSTVFARSSLEQLFQAMQGTMVKPLTGLNPVEPLSCPVPVPNGITDKPALTQPPAYQPGEIKNAANNLLTDLLDQIEKDLGKHPGSGNVVH